jgi:hypothetical protein
VAKTRKSAGKSGSTKKASSKKTSKKPGAKKTARKAARPKQLDLRPLKKQLKAHVDLLSTHGSAGDLRVQNAIARLQRMDAELTEDCDPTMILPLN